MPVMSPTLTAAKLDATASTAAESLDPRHGGEQSQTNPRRLTLLE